MFCKLQVTAQVGSTLVTEAVGVLVNGCCKTWKDERQYMVNHLHFKSKFHENYFNKSTAGGIPNQVFYSGKTATTR